MSPGRRSVGKAGLGLFLAGYAGLVGAWVFTNPPGMSVDEPAHYRKAVALAHGDLLGRPDAYTALPVVTDSELAWLNRNTRSLEVPVTLHGCDAFRLPIDGRCPPDPLAAAQPTPGPGRELSYVATYPPTGYVVPALGTRLAEALGGHTVVALFAGRVLAATVCLALVAGAAVSMLDGAWAPSALAGVALALSPMALFLMAQLSTSGAEVAGALCLTAAALRLTRHHDGGAGRRGPWLALAAGGWTLATSRSLGPAWVVVLLALVVVLRGRRRVGAALAANRRRAAAAAGVVAAGMVLTASWSAVVEPRPSAGLSAVVAGIGPALHQIPHVAGHAVGVFGWVDVDLPPGLFEVWIVLVVALFIGAVVVGTGRERVGLVAAALAALGATIVVSAALIRPTSPDFEMQGRYVLPALLAIPLLAAEVLGGHRERIVARLGPAWRASGLAGGVVAATLVVQALAWRVNARQYGIGSVFDTEYRKAWRPAGGWIPWAVLVVGAVVVAAVGCVRLTSTGRRSRQASGPPAPGPPSPSASAVPARPWASRMTGDPGVT